MEFEGLPGHDLVAEGLADLARGVESVPALLVAIGAPRLRRLGLSVPSTSVADPEHRLYLALSQSGSDSAHARYNALLRRLVSFERARLKSLFEQIEPNLYRYPAIDPASFRTAVEDALTRP